MITLEGRGYTWLPGALTSQEKSAELPPLGILYPTGDDFLPRACSAQALKSVRKRWSSGSGLGVDTNLPGYTSAGAASCPFVGSLNQRTARAETPVKGIFPVFLAM